jgi:hypothetical protein
MAQPPNSNVELQKYLNQNQGIAISGDRNLGRMHQSGNYQSIQKLLNQSFDINKPGGAGGIIGDPSRGRSIVNNSNLG